MEMVGVGFLTVLLLVLKPPYAPLALLYLAIPKSIWPTNAKLATVLATLFVFLAIYGFWAVSYQMVYLIPSLDYSQQVVSVLGSLPRSLLVCFANAVFYISVTSPTSLLYMFIPVAAAVALVSTDTPFAGASQVGLVVAIVLITVTLIYFFLMLTWNDLSGGFQNLAGFQERYLLPLMSALAFLFSGKQGASGQQESLGNA